MPEPVTHPVVPSVGLRERKRIQTRKALSDAALRLFLEHGYDNVTVAQIADEAGVAIATLFKYVPDGKEAVMFDDGLERQQGLVAAVRDRAEGVGVLDSLREFLSSRGPFATRLTPELQRQRDLVVSTPSLRSFQRILWMRSEDVLAAALAAEAGEEEPDARIRAMARFVLEIPDIVGIDPNPRRSLEAIFDLLDGGWANHKPPP